MNYLYAPDSVANRKQVFDEIGEALGANNRLEMFKDIEGVSARLKRFNHPEIIVMLSVGKKDMANIVSMSELFRDAALIIMLSDEDPHTISSALRLRPRFVGITDRDSEKIVPIVKKLIRKKANSKHQYLNDNY